METEHPASADAQFIDREHQVQIRLLQLLTKTIDSGGDTAEMLDQLAEYSRAHFLSEELLMRLYAYPDYDDHVLDHARMNEWLDEMEARKGERGAMLHAAQELTAIFLRHIGSRDKRLHDFLGDL
jgi:hemerythrin